jgi:protein-S-isoprenylcysteine O-methyltransferase Ste14
MPKMIAGGRSGWPIPPAGFAERIPEQMPATHMPTLFLLLLVAGTAPILYLSRRSLLKPQSHGFYRFFVFEGLLFMILLNLEHWFNHPFSVRQIASWFFLALSPILALVGFGLLGKQVHSPLRIEHTSSLVTTGIYRFIRHPLYASLLYLGWGVFLKDVSIASVFLVVVVTFSVTLTALVEERENREKFGEAYTEYMRRTSRFIPYLF